MESVDRRTNGEAVYVPTGGDRFGQDRRVFGALPVTVKVSSQDTGGALLVVEQNNSQKGGPPRHIHHDQDEWFYAVHGEYVVEIGGEIYPLHPGDSVLAPRGVPHTWAHIGEETGRLLIAFQPAGTMESFFSAAAPASATGSAEVAELFAAHGMRLTGPPLKIY